MINGSGQVAFYSDLTGGSSTGGSFVAVPGTVQTVALKGTAAPAGGNYTFLGTPALNGSGQAAIWSGLTGGSSGEGIFAGVPGSLQTVALLGSPTPAGSTYGQFNGIAMNASGQVVFEAVRNIGPGNATAFFLGAPGAVQAVALEGNPAPGGGTYGLLGGIPALNESGQVAFRAGLTNTFATHAIIAGTPGRCKVSPARAVSPPPAAVTATS